ncbi:MAG: arginyl-tRNA synthetase [Acidimicrobiaceae bacterium]|nr:arginyl-tRNA synthetase [Acidimicrobiaceae bacterium]
MTVTREIVVNPAAARLEEVLRGAPAPEGMDFSTLRVEPHPRGVPADFRVDARAAMQNGESVATACTAVADAISGLAEINAVTVVPPNVYLAPTTDALARGVIDAVLSNPTRFGGSPVDQPLYYIVGFSGPNVNKPLHLGHLRNNFVGMAVANLLADKGHTVERQAPHCDWGVHIAQALLAWKKWGDGTTPEMLGEKGDHFVGRHYVLFHQRVTPTLEAEATAMMKALEDGDQSLWAENHRFTQWADKGIRETYARIGTRMDAIYYDKDYLEEGRRLISDAVATGRCIQREDSSVYIDLESHGLGHITLVRRDGTPTVYRQWMAVNIARFPSRPVDRIRVVVGKEWEAGLRAMRQTLVSLGHDWADRMEGVHYGLVVLPEGRMRSRQGSGVAADALLDGVRDRLLSAWSDVGGVPDEAAQTCEALAVGLLKYLFLTVKRSKDVVYSKGLLWQDGLPRFAAVVRATRWATEPASGPGANGVAERTLLLTINKLPNVIDRAVDELEPGHLIRYLDGLVAATRKADASEGMRAAVGVVLRRALGLLGIDLPSSLDNLPPQFEVDVPAGSLS